MKIADKYDSKFLIFPILDKQKVKKKEKSIISQKRKKNHKKLLFLIIPEMICPISSPQSSCTWCPACNAQEMNYHWEFIILIYVINVVNYEKEKFVDFILFFITRVCKFPIMCTCKWQEERVGTLGIWISSCFESLQKSSTPSKVNQRSLCPQHTVVWTFQLLSSSIVLISSTYFCHAHQPLQEQNKRSHSKQNIQDQK